MRPPVETARGPALRARDLLLVLPLLALLAAWAAPPRRVLRVCADPNNLPFSNRKEEGFENRLAELVARELGARVEYTWWAQRRGFFRETLNARQCDLVPGVPTALEMVRPTRPYYRSSYVFVQRRDARAPVRSLDDPALASLRVGVHLVGDDYASTPPAQALAARGLGRNLVGFTVYGDYAQPDPPARLVEAVADGRVDVAIVWGPLAGYFARRQRVPLAVTPVTPQLDPRSTPQAFDVSMGVRRADAAFADTVNAVLARRRAAVDSILDAYGVPRVARPPGARGGRR
ncbi:substrate-binding domain-containing protein [Roseisolibacter sp. H3M3-2]|uniref:substrate-binding domain-containing protein n=1 Tax=Roseisolibacter sp. H3M3-2 TaxID=3031323 RepID=UPI0023DC2A59|nr:substrate-binding domain-containing protein [Roseisolibacter sp. H3M3-2]MDF1503468.1 substrate-binding domain-containing protein [Roseisolibacter sp. H3M3-2]